MEDYDNFVQHRPSHLRKCEEEHKTSPASSLIRFNGQPILPPLLSVEQREEMRRHRDAAQKAAVHRKCKKDARMANVQTLLQSIQLRTTPTLEEWLLETQSTRSHDTSGGSVLQSRVLVSPPLQREEKDGVSLPPLTSTTYSAFPFFVSNVTSQQSYTDGCLIDPLYSQEGSQPSCLNGASHQSVSSGYATNENVTNATRVSSGIDAGRESHGPSEGSYNMSNTSNTIAKMPDIVSHPPIDGEELERIGLESSYCSDFIVVKDISSSLFQEDSNMCGHLPADKCESSHVVSTEDEDNLPAATLLDLDKDHSLDRIKTLENSGSSNNPELSQTFSTRHCLTTELHIQRDPTEREAADTFPDEAEPSEEPCRPSLQALLKKSQECRRRQQMLRNQAKNTKNQERTQELARERTEEQSLSDKENDELPYKGTVTAGGKKTKARRGSFILPEESSPKKSWQIERMIETESFGEKVSVESESPRLTEDGNTKEMTSVEDETAVKNNQLNISQQVVMETKQIIGDFPEQQPVLTETFGEGKYHTIPVPNLCRSPVHCKSKGSIQDGEAALEMSQAKVLVNTGLNEEYKVEEVNLEHRNGHEVSPSAVSPMVADDVTRVVTMNSQHLGQLESNLSGLKVLISHLESISTESESKTQSELSFEGVKPSEQSHNEQHVQLDQAEGDCDHLKIKLRDGALEQDQRYSEWPRRQSSVTSDTDNAPHIGQVKGTDAVSLNELRLVKTLALERAKRKVESHEGLTKSSGQHGGCRKQQPPAKSLLSGAQWLRVPDVFRNNPPETTAQRSLSVLSDTSNRLVERTNETEVEDSAHPPSLNQSYDVDTPSGLWFSKGSGTDSGSRGRLVREKHLTPESGDEGQGGASKVKRRLRMHVTEETQERSPDAARGTVSAVRPDSSTPKAAVRWQEGHGSPEDKQEQLKRAHAAQIRALREEHRRQQEQLVQALEVHYRLQSVSFPCSMSSSRLGDTLTFSTPSQPSSPLPERYRPLLLAAMKGFLTRRLLKTERVAQLVRTVGDMQQFLQALQLQGPGRGEMCSSQDLLLHERVTLQLRAARYEVNDIFFSMSAAERMQLISWDRELARERELRRQSGHAGKPAGKSSLSAATQKSLERKKGELIQKIAAGGRHRGALTRTGHNAEPRPETRRGQFRANPQRVPKSTYSFRPR